MNSIFSGYTPDNQRFDLVLEDARLYIVTADSKELFNEEYYSEDDTSALRSVRADLISNGYRLS